MASKGTAAAGQKGKGRLHIKCRRCGKNAFHKKSCICSSCGYGKSKRLRKYSWMKKKISKWGHKAKNA